MLKMAILAILLVARPLAGQPLTQGERDMAMSHLHASRKMLLDAIEGLSEKQWRFKPDPGRWSAAEVVEHLAICEDALYKEVTVEILKTPPVSEEDARKLTKNDAQVLETMTSRDQKLQAIESQRPTGRWKTKEALVSHFKEGRDRAIAYLQTTSEQLRRHLAPHHALGHLDAYQCFLALSAHTERHIAQIKQITQHPGFPIE